MKKIRYIGVKADPPIQSVRKGNKGDVWETLDKDRFVCIKGRMVGSILHKDYIEQDVRKGFLKLLNKIK